ncbi:MAG: hypothetical protein ACI35R_17425 [Bacillus sp. (in: firmicutes)]
MAEKKESKTKAETEKKATSEEVIKSVEENETVLSDAEKEAIKVVTGESSGKKYKLADPKTQFSDADFTLAGDQEKELPENPSTALVARIRSGFIVEV